MKNLPPLFLVIIMASCDPQPIIKPYTFEVYRTDSKHYNIDYHHQSVKGFTIFIDGDRGKVESGKTFEQIIADNYGCNMSMTIIHNETWVRVEADGVDEVKMLE